MLLESCKSRFDYIILNQICTVICRTFVLFSWLFVNELLSLKSFSPIFLTKSFYKIMCDTTVAVSVRIPYANSRVRGHRSLSGVFEKNIFYKDCKIEVDFKWFYQLSWDKGISPPVKQVGRNKDSRPFLPVTYTLYITPRQREYHFVTLTINHYLNCRCFPASLFCFLS